MSPKFVLTYFDVPALAEPVRLVLAMSGQPWEDKRIGMTEFFETLKPTFPQQQVPVLEFDGKMLPQSNAQLRYVGKLGGLYPWDPVEAAFADAAVDAVTDNHFKLAPTFFMKDLEKRAELCKDLEENFLPTWLSNQEKALKKAGGEYFAGGKLSIGDIAITCRVAWLKSGTIDGIPATIVDDYPLLCALIERVMSEPKIVAYTESRNK